MLVNQIQNPFEAIYQEIHRQGKILEEIRGVVNSSPTNKSVSYHNVKGAADFLSKTPNAIRVMVCKNQLRASKKNGRLYFLESDLIDYLESGQRKSLKELASDSHNSLKG